MFPIMLMHGRKKTRCSGKQPCTLCTQTGATCDFTAAYTRGRIPSVLPDDSHTLNAEDRQHALLNNDQVIGAFGTDHLTQSLHQPGLFSSTSDPEANELNQSSIAMVQSQLPLVDRVDSRMQSSRNSPEPSQIDLQGHYVGPSSGVSFLLRVQRKLHQKISFSQNSSIFTFGDAPISSFDPSFFLLPPREDAEKLVSRYFDFAVATHRFLHRPTVEAWFKEFYESR
jgi:hypothetical protein